jgi:hypothetical protein
LRYLFKFQKGDTLPNLEQFKAKKPGFIILLIGHFKTGKTLQAATFPKFYGISCDPAGFECIRNTIFEDNLVNVEYFLSENKDELRTMFTPTDDVNNRQSIYGCLADAKARILRGEVETVILDGFTYFNSARVASVWEYEAVTTSAGEVDSQQTWGKLQKSMNNFLLTNFLPMATRYGVNIVITCHLQRLSEEERLGPDDIGASQRQKQQNRKRRRGVQLQSDLAPRIEGGLRQTIEGMVSATIYFEKRLDPARGIVYEAICDLAPGMGTIVPAGNRFMMVPKIDITNGSLWDELQPETIARRRVELEAKGRRR